MKNTGNNPQDKAPSISRATRKYERLLKSIPEPQYNVPQSVKSVEASYEVLKKCLDKEKIVYEFDEHEDYIGDQDYAFSAVVHAMDEYAAPFQSRIAELEAEIKSFEPLITALEMGNLKLEARNKELTEALERIFNTDIDNYDLGAIDQAERALKKDGDETNKWDNPGCA